MWPDADRETCRDQRRRSPSDLTDAQWAPPHRRIEAIFGTLTTRHRRLMRPWEQSSAAAEDAISIANCHRLRHAYHRAQHGSTWSNRL